MKKLASLWLSLLFALGTLTGCAGDVSIGVIGGADGPTNIIVSSDTDHAQAETPPDDAAAIDEDGQYDTRDEVAQYLTEYGHLPSNYITKKQAQALGWEGGSLEPYAPGCAIGGDRFGNYEGALPEPEDIGEVAGVIRNPSQRLLRVTLDGDGDDGREILVPYVHALVPIVDVDNGAIVITPPDGLLEL